MTTAPVSYEWLRQPEDPVVRRHLETENAYAAAAMANLEPLVEELYREMLSRAEADAASLPVRKGDYWYRVRREPGRSHLVYCRKRADGSALEEVLLDENTFAEELPCFALQAFRLSPDQRRLAIAADVRGDERLHLWVRDLDRQDAPFRKIAEGAGPGLAWGNDGETLYHTELDETLRPCRVVRRRLDGGAGPEVLYEEADPAFHLHLGKTESEAFVVCASASLTSSELRLLAADVPAARFRLLHPRRPGVRCALTHAGSRLFLLTNDGAENFRVLAAPAGLEVEPEAWSEVIPAGDASIERIEALRHHLILHVRHRGMRRIRIHDLVTGELHQIRSPEPIATFHPAENWDLDTPVLRIGYSSPTVPYTVVEYDLATRYWDIRLETPVPDFRRGDYCTERLSALAPDGTSIPVSLVYRKDRRSPDGNPLVLYAYGAYGRSVELDFDPARLSLLDRGVIFAVAHVRGGGELGQAWHDQGRRLAKRNSILDFLACARHLVATGYARPGRIAAMGESAGGLLVAAAANEAPELFTAILTDCPFVDPVTSLLDPSLPLTAIDREEWGDPSRQEDLENLLSYAPLAGLRPQAYPAMRVTAGLHDPRVPYWQPAEWVARLREMQTDLSRPILLETDLDGGHWGASGHHGHLERQAKKYAFLLSRLGVA